MSTTELGLHDPVAESRHMLQAAQWAASAFAEFDAASTWRVVDAAANVADEHAERLAHSAVAETGFGVVEDKTTKNRAVARSLADHYRSHNFVEPVVDVEQRLVRIPSPAGVVFALIPSTNPISTLYFKVLIALMTRNAIVISPHPAAVNCTREAAELMRDAAVSAGAPECVIQVVPEPSVSLAQALMADPATNVTVATGGSAMVRAAYSSGNPAIGVGPGNAPIVVDATADINLAASSIVTSKSFDNGLLCSADSVLLADTAISGNLERALKAAGAYLCSDEERDRIRSLLFGSGHINPGIVGRSATWIAQQAGIGVPPKTKVLLTPVELVAEEEMLVHEKLSPVLAYYRGAGTSTLIRGARAVLRVTGKGHCAGIFTSRPEIAAEYARAVDVLRVTWNTPNSLAVAGLASNLPITMTIGTGFAGRSSLGENLQPKHLLNWRVVAYASDPAMAFPGWPERERSQMPASLPGPRTSSSSPQDIELRSQIRRILREEMGVSGRG